LGVLGATAKDVLSSGDPTQDGDVRAGFVVRYQSMHRFVTEANGTVTLVVGAENWPFPIPLVNKQGKWYFDTDAGKDEIVFRRIGANEIAAQDACANLVEAEKEYFARPPAGLTKQFAQKMVSEEGRHDGLYWHGAYDEFYSPINALIARTRKDPVPADPTTRKCPECLSEIPIDARRCSHCAEPVMGKAA